MSNKILISTVGLPRSGKSAWSQAKKFPIVNPDSIRLALHGQRFQELAEPFIWAIAKTMVRSLFLSGHNIVILDATNMTKKRRDFWIDKTWETYFKIFNTTSDECIKRAMENNDQDIIPIIHRMAEEYEDPLLEPETKVVWF